MNFLLRDSFLNNKSCHLWSKCYALHRFWIGVLGFSVIHRVCSSLNTNQNCCSDRWIFRVINMVKINMVTNCTICRRTCRERNAPRLQALYLFSGIKKKQSFISTTSKIHIRYSIYYRHNWVSTINYIDRWTQFFFCKESFYDRKSLQKTGNIKVNPPLKRIEHNRADLCGNQPPLTPKTPKTVRCPFIRLTDLKWTTWCDTKSAPGFERSGLAMAGSEMWNYVLNSEKNTVLIHTLSVISLFWKPCAEWLLIHTFQTSNVRSVIESKM